MANNITGGKTAEEILRDYPNKINAVTKKALRAAVKGPVKDIKAGLKGSLKKKVKAKFIKDGGKQTILFGVLGKKGEGDRDLDWFKIYWKNYGTLTKRYSGHKFENPRKKITANWRGGASPTLNFDRATAGKEEIMSKIFVDELLKEAKKLTE